MALVETLTDDFNTGTVPDPAKWATSGLIAPALTGDQLRLQSAAAGTNYARVQGQSLYTLTGSSFFVKVTPRATGGSHQTSLAFFDPTLASQVMILTAGTNIAYGLSSALNFPRSYDPVADKWWRISESGGTVSYHTSPDGFTWNLLGTTAAPAWAPSGYAVLETGHYAVESVDTDSLYDNFNVLTKVETLTDDFSTTLDPVKWGAVGTIPPAISNGQLRLQSAAAGTNYAGVQSIGHYTLIDSSFYAKVTPSPTSGSHEHFLEFGAGTVVGVAVSGSNLMYGLSSGRTTARAYNPVTDAWWKISESGGTVTFWVSPDGINWTSIGTIATPAFASNGQLQSFAGHYSVEAANTDTQVDNLNLLPGQVSTVQSLLFPFGLFRPSRVPILQTPGPSVSADATPAATDSATETDSSSLAAGENTTESATLTDARALQAQEGVVDSATETDASNLQAQENRPDSGTLSDSSSYAAAVGPNDTLVGSDTAAGQAQLPVTDSASFSESAVVDAVTAVTASDSVSFSESASVAITIATTESSVVTDQGADAASFTPTDSFTLSELAAASTDVPISAADSANFSDSASVSVTLAVVDSAGVTDQRAVDVNLTRTDTATVGDVSTPSMQPSRTDSFSFTDMVNSTNATLSTLDAFVETDGSTDAIAFLRTESGTLTDSAVVVIPTVTNVDVNDLFSFSEAVSLRQTTLTVSAIPPPRRYYIQRMGHRIFRRRR